MLNAFSLFRKLYWTTTRQMGIYVSELNGTFVKAIVSEFSPNCRGITVHPTVGFVSAEHAVSFCCAPFNEGVV
jgi:hypothetical protein